MFFLQDLGECINNSFFGDKTPIEVQNALQNGTLFSSLAEDRKAVLAYLQHMTDWTVEEVQMSHFAHKNGMSVIHHIEREKFGHSTSQQKFYEKTRIETEKEDKKNKNKSFNHPSGVRRGAKSGRGAPVRGFRGGHGGRGGSITKNTYTCTICNGKGHLAEFCRRGREGKGRGGGSGAPGIAN